MDQVKAEEYLDRLKDEEFDGWRIETLIDNGKSAAVFKASKGNEYSALKVFDKELIDKFGEKEQFVRIERELELVGHSNPNMVQIFSGGKNDNTGHLYIIMEYLDAPNLSKSYYRIPEENFKSLMSQLASAAKFLEEMGLCHRDIKPENIVVFEDTNRLVLLDLGVIRPIGIDGLTDQNGLQPFIGTLQYSSPEFLLRNETDTTEGWRALTFYQIGGVLHDLLMRKPLFDDFKEPWPTLVHAVADETPEISCDSHLSDLANLAGRCLIKCPEVRSGLVNWEDFDFLKRSTPATAAKRRVTERFNLGRAQRAQIKCSLNDQSAEREQDLFKAEIIEFIKTLVASIRVEQAAVPMGPTNLVSDDALRLSFDTGLGNTDSEQSFQVLLKIEILDLASKAIKIIGLARFGVDETMEWPSGEIHSTIVFQNIYETNAITNQLEEFIYVCLDLAHNPLQSFTETGWMNDLPERL